MQKGWHFGNIAGETLGVTWAYIVKDRFNVESIGVLNQKNEKPIEINPEDVKITVTEYAVSNRRRIPKKVTLEIENERLHVDISMETLNTNHVRLPILNYWRYHLRIFGTITLDSVTENIDNIGISEFMRFF
jgi:predicted secreted hydrolase